jgi:hypothetical protein
MGISTVADGGSGFSAPFGVSFFSSFGVGGTIFKLC